MWQGWEGRSGQFICMLRRSSVGDSRDQNIDIASALSPSLQIWTMEASRRCMSLLNSQDGGILTVSFSQGIPETASFVVFLLFSYPFEVITPLGFCWSEVQGGQTPQNDSHNHINTKFACSFRGFGNPHPVHICLSPRTQELELRISFLYGLNLTACTV